MTQIAAICSSLLKGDVLSIMDGFSKFACTNLPRELSRSVEKKFNVTISKTRIDFTSRYGHPGYYYQYRLNKSDHNMCGIEIMKKYVESQQPSPQTKKKSKFVQPTMF